MKKVISTVRSVFIYPIRFYQRHISPRRPACCKYYPTCSQYAITAIQRFGVIVGGFLALWRILRCNPWSKGGIDPVPERLFSKKQRRNNHVGLYYGAVWLHHEVRLRSF